MPKPKIHYLLMLGAVVVIATEGFAFIDQEQKEKADGTVPPRMSERRQAETNPVCALGRLEPEGEVIRVSAGSRSASAIRKLIVKEGQTVRAGQIIAILDQNEIDESEIAIAKQQASLAAARLEQAKAPAKMSDICAEDATIARIQTELNQAKLDADRYWFLSQEGAVSTSESEHYRTKLDAKRCELEAATNSKQSLIESRDVDVKVAEADLSVANARVQRALAQQATNVVRTPTDGVVLSINARAGEREGSEGIATIAKTNVMYARADVYENDIRQVRLGERATITSATFPGELSGTVWRIGNEVVAQDLSPTDPAAEIDRRVVHVWIRIAAKDIPKCRNFTNAIVEVKLL